MGTSNLFVQNLSEILSFCEGSDAQNLMKLKKTVLSRRISEVKSLFPPILEISVLRQYTRRTFGSKQRKTCFSCSKTNQVQDWTTFVRTCKCKKFYGVETDFMVLVPKGFAKGICGFHTFWTLKNRPSTP